MTECQRVNKDRIQSTDRSVFENFWCVHSFSHCILAGRTHEKHWETFPLLKHKTIPSDWSNWLRISLRNMLRISIRKPGNVFCQSTQVKMVTWKKTPFCFPKIKIKKTSTFKGDVDPRWGPLFCKMVEIFPWYFHVLYSSTTRHCHFHEMEPSPSHHLFLMAGWWF